jgi:hypothetical protein
MSGPSISHEKVYPPALKTLKDPIQSGPILSFWAPETKVGSPYEPLIPKEIPDSSTIALDQATRERIIREGEVPSIVPAALGLRAWLAERRINRHQKTAEALLGRKARVAAFVGKQVINQSGYMGLDEEYRPKSTAERIMAWRMHAKWHKATIKNADANNIAAPYRVRGGDSLLVNFEKNFENLSVSERGRARKAERRHSKLGRQSSRLMQGRTMPIINREINGYEQFMTKPLQKAQKALEKRNKAVLKAEGLRKQEATNRLARQAIRNRKYHAIWGSAKDIADKDKH